MTAQAPFISAGTCLSEHSAAHAALMPHSTLLVVAKEPRPGAAKTRLCPPLDQATAAALYACFLRDIIELMRNVPVTRREIVYQPATARDYFQTLAPDMALSVQQGAGLAERLDRLLSVALATGAQRAVVMSSDSPSLPAAYVAQAFALLETHEVVLGPCDDGGYYLIGLTAPQPQLFHRVPMSTATVTRDTLAVASELGLRTALLPPWYDIDTAADLERLCVELRTAPVTLAPHTRSFLMQKLGL